MQRSEVQPGCVGFRWKSWYVRHFANTATYSGTPLLDSRGSVRGVHIEPRPSRKYVTVTAKWRAKPAGPAVAHDREGRHRLAKLPRWERFRPMSSSGVRVSPRLLL